MNNLRGIVLALPLATLLAGCPIYFDDGGGHRPPVHRDGGTIRVDAGGPIPLCRSDRDCAAGMICETAVGICVPGPVTCLVDGDCPTGDACVAGTCEPAPTCTTDNTCGVGEWCDGRGTCIDPPAGACRTVADCAAGQVCVGGACQDVADTCQFNRECGAGTVCLDNACTPICNASTPCPSGTVCIDSYCQAATECATSSDCAAGEHCVGGQCFVDCHLGAGCPVGEFCADDGFCRADWREVPVCVLDSDCMTGRVCREGVCRTPCTDDASCQRRDAQVPLCRPVGAELFCFAATEGAPECRVATDCAGLEHCIDGDCRVL